MKSTPQSIEFSYGDAVSDSQSLSTLVDDGLTDVEKDIIERVASGVSIEKAYKYHELTRWHFQQLREKKPAFDRHLARARAMLQEERVDSIHEIARTEPDVNRAKVLIDGIKWVAGKYNRQFSDRLDINVTQTIDIGSALAEAKARMVLRPRCDPADIIDVQVIDSQDNKHAQQIDNESTPPVPDIFD